MVRAGGIIYNDAQCVGWFRSIPMCVSSQHNKPAPFMSNTPGAGVFLLGFKIVWVNGVDKKRDQVVHI